MKKILIIGAGRSASSLIRYLIREGITRHWQLLIADTNPELAREKAAGHENARAIPLDILHEEQRENAVRQADLVISMLPAQFHRYAAKACIKFSKNLLTASYVSDDMAMWHDEAVRKDLIFLNECGLDPGIDHMTAMQAIDRIVASGAELTSFKSYTGGLVAPESDNNPWHYKFTWNPRNVVMAGQGTPAKFIRNGRYKYIPYHKLFTRYETIHVPGYGDFEAYPNRDSLPYRKVYGLPKLPTIIRGTLRGPGYCQAWDSFVQLGMTDDTYQVEGVDKITWREFVDSFLACNERESVETKLCKYLGINAASETFRKLAWLGIFEDRPVGLKRGTPAQVLQHLLEKKWKLDSGDKDMIVMQHQFEYTLRKKHHLLTATMVSKGDDSVNTAMSKTVGWPLGIAAKLILGEKIKARGVQIPTAKEFYEPLLSELERLGITFMEDSSFIA